MSSYQEYGKFIDDGFGFELQKEAPRKWFNTLLNDVADDELYAEVSNVSDGEVTIRDREGNMLTLLSYDDCYLYIRDDEDNTVFNPAGAPCVQQELDSQVTRFYPWMNEYESRCVGLKARQRIFVPRTEPILVWDTVVTNESDRDRTVSVFAYTKFSLMGKNKESQGVWPDNRGEILEDLGAVFIKNFNQKVPTNRFNGYLMTLDDFTGANAYRDHFTYHDYSVSTPRIIKGWNCDGRGDAGPDCAGIIQCTVTIPANSEHRFAFVVGQCSGPEEIKAVRERLTFDSLDTMLAEQEAAERQRAAGFTIDIGNDHYNALLNCWTKKQWLTYIVHKSGFRDNLQVDYALAMSDAEMAKDNLRKALASQWADGCVPHGFRPLVRHKYSDKPAWIFLAIPWLIKETGDLSFLDEVIPYFESDESGTIWDHMLRTMRYMVNDLGPNGLSNQRYADWNDGLESTKEAGERESIMVTQQLAYGLREMEELARQYGKEDIATEAAEHYATIKKNLNDNAWDGRWYVRTICEDGYRIGSDEHAEAKVWMNTQTWAVLSGTATEERSKALMGVVDEWCEVNDGYKVLHPPFTKYDPRVGIISNFLPDTRTNGGCYNHAAGFKAVADCMMGRAEEAWRTFQKVAPDSPYLPITRSGAEPFSFNNYYVMDQPGHPRYTWKSGYAWKTGTAAWFGVALIEWMLGVRRHYDGLLIDPCLTKELPIAKITRRFRGAVYNISIDNTAGRCTGVTSITVDGETLDGNILPVFEGGEHTVTVVI